MGRKFMSEFMAERINYGGQCATREQAYKHALNCLLSRTNNEESARRAADMFAFGPRAVALSNEEAERLPEFSMEAMR